MNKLEKYLPKPDEKVVLIQARIPQSLVKDLKSYTKQNHLGWAEFMTACLTMARDEIRLGKVKAKGDAA